MKQKLKIFTSFIITIILLQTIVLGSTKDLSNLPKINSETALLIEESTGKIIFEKNSNEKRYPASTTKIMTAILVLENSNLSDTVTITQTALDNIPTGYVTCNLQVGENLTVEDLLYALLLPSANDAAYALAEHIGGSVEGFSDMMNKKAEELGCKNTHFVNPNGIHDDEHYSTAYDLYLITEYALQNEDFKRIVSTTNYTLPATDKYPNEDRFLKTTNELITTNSKNYYEYAIGIKTGHTTQAGNCLVAGSEKDNIKYISVTLNNTEENGQHDRFADAKKLFEYAYSNYSFSDIVNQNSIITQIEVENGTKDTKSLDLIIDKTLTAYHNNDLDLKNIEPEINLNENILAPIEANQILGTITYTVDDLEYTANLLAKTNVDQKIDIGIFLLIAGFVLLIFSMLTLKKSNHKNKKRKKRK